MFDERTAERWISILGQEESHLARLVALLQSDQDAVAQGRVDIVEENVHRKEAVIAEMRVVAEARRGLLAAAGRQPAGQERGFDELLAELPQPFHERGTALLGRVRSLRQALAELNELTRRIMMHGLMLVRATLGVIRGPEEPLAYSVSGDVRSAGGTGRLLRRNA